MPSVDLPRGIHEIHGSDGRTTYRVRVLDTTGKRHNRILPSRHAALALYETLKGVSLGGPMEVHRKPDPSVMRLGEAIERTINERWAGNKSLKSSKENAARALAYFGDIPVEAITFSRIEAWKRHMQTVRGNAPGTVNRHLAALNVILKHARDHEALTNVPSVNKLPEPEGRVRVVSEAEEQHILNQMRIMYGHDAADIVAWLLDTAMRTGEAFKLEVRDLTPPRGEQRAYVTLRDTKNGSTRAVPLTRRAEAIALDWQKRAVAEGRTQLLPLRDRQHGYRWGRLRRALGLADDKELVRHSLRHSSISRIVASVQDIAVAGKFAGHRSIQSTMRYAHYNRDVLERAAKALDR